MRYIVAVPLFFGVMAHAQNVGINATGAAPDASAMLDISATNRGLLVPRVPLTATNNNAPIGAGVVQSLLVFNTATTAGVNGVTPGYYYWSGAPANQWVRFAGDGDAWRTDGNAGTVAATNFLGTTDAIALRIRTQNFERFEISAGTGTATGTGGRLLAFHNGLATSPVYSWSTDPNMGMFRQNTDVLGFATNSLERLRIMANGQVVIPGAAPAATDYFTTFGPAAMPYAINGYGSAGGSGVWGQTAVGEGVTGVSQTGGVAGVGVWGIHTAATGTAVLGLGNNVGFNLLLNGSGGAFIGSSIGTWGNGLLIGHYGTGGAAGYGFAGAGNGAAAALLAIGGGGTFTGTANGSYGRAVAGTGTGVLGVGNNSPFVNMLGTGGGGAFTGSVTGAIGYGTNAANSTGIVGAGNNVVPAPLATGSGGAFAGTTTGAYGVGTTAATGVGVVGAGNNIVALVPADGAGGAFTGNPQGVYGRGMTAATGLGVIGAGNGLVPTTIPNGAGGSFRGTIHGAVGSTTTAANGTGLVGLGNNEGTFQTLAVGSGVAGTGTNIGIFGAAMSIASGAAGAPARAGGYFASAYTTGVPTETFTYVAAMEGAGVPRKVMGNGTVNTVVRDMNDDYVLLSAPEAPENLFQDYGTGQLVNGRARIELDPILSKNILVNDQHPLRVFVQLRGDCNGVYVTNESAEGFEVVELMGGDSDASFFWTVTANRGNTLSPSGTPWNFAEERFARTAGPMLMNGKTVVPMDGAAEVTLTHAEVETMQLEHQEADLRTISGEEGRQRMERVRERTEKREAPSMEDDGKKPE